MLKLFYSSALNSLGLFQYGIGYKYIWKLITSGVFILHMKETPIDMESYLNDQGKGILLLIYVK